MSAEFDPPTDTYIELPGQDSWPASRHRFDRRSVWAIRNAIGAGRPLLLRGEPGIGKSQLARAAAVWLRVPFLYHVVDERSERDDLLFSYDAISRLAEAQVSALVAKEGSARWRDRLAEKNYLRPGPLWWAINWKSADDQTDLYDRTCERQTNKPAAPKEWSPTAERLCGPVVLIDEIDKADPSVPNGLLESLGNDGFQTAQLPIPVRRAEGARKPLIIVTTNEERELPAAFLRRCLVLQMLFPQDRDKKQERDLIERFLIERARVFHTKEQISDDVLKKIVQQLMGDREAAKREGLAIPGAAEFLDIVRYLADTRGGNESAQSKALIEISEFSLRKNLLDIR